MKRIWNGFRAAIVSGTLGTPAGATVIASNVVEVSTDAGLVGLTSRVEDEFSGDETRWLFAYELRASYGALRVRATASASCNSCSAAWWTSPIRPARRAGS